jgi:hypothetical protein
MRLNDAIVFMTVAVGLCILSITAVVIKFFWYMT